jgi:hypothetical protein
MQPTANSSIACVRGCIVYQLRGQCFDCVVAVATAKQFDVVLAQG